MPKIIAISGEIGWDVWPDQIREQIEAAAGEDIEFQISSPGGYVYDGIEIFNLIRGYEGNTTARIIGMAASMASYIPLAADKVIAESNAIYMIHNAAAFSYGDQNAHRKLSNILEGMSNMLGQEYVKQTGKSKEEIKALMDEETYFFGNEILDAGFVDEIVNVESEEVARDDVVIEAMVKVEAVIEKLKSKPEDTEKIAAILPKNQASEPDQKSVQRSSAQIENPKTEVNMSLDKLLAEHPEAKKEHDALIAAAEKKGADSVQNKIEAVKPFLQSDEYTDIHEECIGVMLGTEEVLTVRAMAKVLDKQKALLESKEAKEETDKQDESFSGKSQKSTDGIIRNAEDEAAAIAEMRGL